MSKFSHLKHLLVLVGALCMLGCLTDENDGPNEGGTGSGFTRLSIFWLADSTYLNHLLTFPVYNRRMQDPIPYVSLGDTVQVVTIGVGADSLGWLDIENNRHAWMWVDGKDSTDTLAVAAPVDPGMYRLFAIGNSGGRIYWDTLTLSVVKDAPRANAGPDTVVSVHDTVRLNGRATQLFGRIAKWEWDIGCTGQFKTVASGETTAVAKPDIGFEYHVLRVTDDDGNSALDTLKVTILEDVPVLTLE